LDWKIENMLLTDWNLKDALEVEREEAEARGEARGEARAEARILDLMKKGYDFKQIEEILKKKELEICC